MRRQTQWRRRKQVKQKEMKKEQNWLEQEMTSTPGTLEKERKKKERKKERKKECRNTAIIVHSDWEIMETRNHPSGGLLAARLRNGNFQLMVISAYLPPGLDRCGRIKMPEAKASNQDVPRQFEAE